MDAIAAKRVEFMLWRWCTIHTACSDEGFHLISDEHSPISSRAAAAFASRSWADQPTETGRILALDEQLLGSLAIQ